MPPSVPFQDGLDAIACIANEANSDKFISANSTYFEYNTTEDYILFSEKDLNNLIKDLCFYKKKAELLALRLKQQNMVEKNVKINYYRKRNRDFFSALKFEGPLCYCHDIEKLFRTLGIFHTVDEWRFFIDFSKRSLKAVFLHVGNKRTSIPIPHSDHLKESYENILKFSWHLLKQVGVIGYAKH